jgi:hypothetical protein
MARFRCRVCAQEGEFVCRSGRHECPNCGSRDVQFALSIEELPNDHPLIEALKRLAEEDDNED